MYQKHAKPLDILEIPFIAIGIILTEEQVAALEKAKNLK
jgi:hypothetical protein